jgi:hypothetical protein
MATACRRRNSETVSRSIRARARFVCAYSSLTLKEIVATGITEIHRSIDCQRVADFPSEKPKVMSLPSRFMPDFFREPENVMPRRVYPLTKCAPNSAFRGLAERFRQKRVFRSEPEL